MSKGFRLKPLPSKKEQHNAIKTELENLSMANRISQLMVKNLMTSNQNLSQDLGRALNLINELQYKVLAVQEVAKLDTKAMTEVADRLRLKDFNEASDKEDLDKGFEVIDTVEADSTIIITSTTAEGNGIFRSRVTLQETGMPALIEGLMGKKVGHKLEVELNGVMHNIELLAVRKPTHKLDTTEPLNPAPSEGNA